MLGCRSCLLRSGLPVVHGSSKSVYILPVFSLQASHIDHYVVVVCGAVPMLFVAYTAAPFVNYVHLALPAFARRSREEILKYAQNLPPTCTLYINTMRFTTIPRRTEVCLSDLTPGRSTLRPVNIINTNPERQSWWKGKTITNFYVSEKSKSTKATSTFYPEVWKYVYGSIKKNVSSQNNIRKVKQWKLIPNNLFSIQYSLIVLVFWCFNIWVRIQGWSHENAFKAAT